ncbi:MAG TPA: arabinose transporter [Roseiarcus sp.]|nr:arabinose transporter [Roseiarcus sp.]
MSAAASQQQIATRSVVTALLPLMAVVFVVFLITGVALPALPLHVHQGLGLGTFVVGLVAGSQFAASLVSRVWAGAYSDGRGAKRAVIAGLIMATAAGLLYLVSLRFLGAPLVSVTILLLGRGLLGGAESFTITAAQSWGLTLAGPNHAGKVIAWLGTAMYAAFAAGAPLGAALYAAYGFAAIAIATMLVPIATLLIIAPLRPVPPKPHLALAFAKVASAVWAPGVGLAFTSVGFGAMTAFSVLLFVERGWEPAWLAYTAFAVAFMVPRIVLGHLADRMGGAKVALVFAIIESAGQALIWLSPWALLGFIGAAVTGFGYSLVYPGLGVEAVRRAPPQAQGLAIGVYTAFLDVALGILSPVLGLVAGFAGLGSIFLISALLALCAIPIAARLLTPADPGEPIGETP